MWDFFNLLTTLFFNKLYQINQDQSCWGSGRTLRETALESSAVVQLLNDKFISSWSLVADLKDCINNSAKTKEQVFLCQSANDAYTFPVTSMVIAPNGTVVSTMNANTLLDLASEHGPSFYNIECPISYEYKKFLLGSINE